MYLPSLAWHGGMVLACARALVWCDKKTGRLLACGTRRLASSFSFYSLYLLLPRYHGPTHPLTLSMAVPSFSKHLFSSAVPLVAPSSWTGREGTDSSWPS